MRADARRNRERLLDAATETILEVGAEPPLDAIARRADVGIGTLYRHFPDRESLLHAVARHVLEHAIAAATSALDESCDGHDALRRYMHAAVERGVGVLNVIQPLLDEPDWTGQRNRITPLLETILQRGRQDGLVRQDFDVLDLVVEIVRFSRPVQLGLSRSEERALAHRHLDIYIDGLSKVPPHP